MSEHDPEAAACQTAHERLECARARRPVRRLEEQVATGATERKLPKIGVAQPGDLGLRDLGAGHNVDWHTHGRKLTVEVGGSRVDLSRLERIVIADVRRCDDRPHTGTPGHGGDLHGFGKVARTVVERRKDVRVEVDHAGERLDRRRGMSCRPRY